MSATSTIERPKRTVEQATWTCPNCSGESRAHRKRCSDCGTSRH
jgi:DnaJ-class molecular chaperone